MERIKAIFRMIFKTLFNVRFCERCGGVIWVDSITRCPHCDFRVRDADEKSWGLFALGLIPVVGLISGIIAFFVCRSKGKKRKAKSAISGAFLGLLLTVIVGVVACIGLGII